MENCVFTICATNYVGLAEVLEQSVKKHSGNCDFFIVVADEPSMECRRRFPYNVIVAKDILHYTHDDWYDMAFKYTITEFCTSIKPSSILHFIEQGYKKVVYLDPDILFYSSIDCIFEHLDKYDCVVTPHVTIPTQDYSDKRLLSSGSFNFGFVAFSNSPLSIKILRWWDNRLKKFAFDSIPEGLFTDQKWGDMIPSYMGDKLKISHNLGLNLAPWNFKQREIINKDGKIYVRERNNSESEMQPLVFVHYSGFNYKALLENKVAHKNMKDIERYHDLNLIFKTYSDVLLQSNFSRFIEELYTYNYFSGDNTRYVITNEMRRLYRGFAESEKDKFDKKDVFLLGKPVFQLFSKLGLITTNKMNISFKYDTESKAAENSAKKMSCIFSILYKIIKPSRYFKLLRIFRRLSILENHYFLLLRNKDDYEMRKQ